MSAAEGRVFSQDTEDTREAALAAQPTAKRDPEIDHPEHEDSELQHMFEVIGTLEQEGFPREGCPEGGNSSQEGLAQSDDPV